MSSDGHPKLSRGFFHAPPLQPPKTRVPFRYMKRMVGSIFAALALVAPSALEAQGDAGTLARGLNDAFVSVYEKVAPAVVVIESREAASGGQALRLPQGLNFFFRSPDGRRLDPGPDQGSGFIIREDGLILTNNHVVQNGARGKITVTLQDGRKFPARLVGADGKSDIAILKIEAGGLPVITLGDSDLAKVGQFAFAIGAPFDLPYTFTVGVISAKGRTNLTGNRNYEEFIQTDASINPGNSGGPLCDLDGNVIGINTLISGMNRGLGFAIPINLVKDVAGQLITKGRVARPWLGIGIVGLQEDERRKALFPDVDAGVLVESIEPDTPAYHSSLQPGDVVLSVDGRRVAFASDLQREILAKSVGQNVSLEVWRAGHKLKVAIRTGEQPDQFQRASLSLEPEPAQPEPETRPAPPAGNETQGWHLLGLHLQEGDNGATIVEAVEPGSPAQAAGLEPGDRLSEIGGQTVASMQECRKVLEKADFSRGVMILLERDGQKTFAILKP